MSFSAYPAYMDAGVDWLGKIPEHWQQKWLGLLAVESRTAFVDGPFGSDLKSSDYQEEGVPLIQLNNIRDGHHVLRNMKFISEEKRNELSRHSAFPGDIVIAKMADPVARSAIVSDTFAEYVIVADCVKMTPDLASVDLSFLIWAINSDCVRISAELMSSGVTRIRINLGQVKKLKIPYPPICEQNQIARFLDHEAARIDALIEEQQRLIELLKEKRQAVISHAVTKGLDPTVPMKDSGEEWLGEVPAHWPLPKLGHLARVLNGSTPSRENMDYWREGDIPWVASGSLNDYRIDLASEFITRKALKECSVEMIPRGAILVGLVGQGKTRGLAALLNIEATINQNVCAVVPNKEKVLSGFLHLYLHCIYETLRDFGRGANQAALNCELVSAVRIPLPCMEEQSRIVKYVESKLNEFDALEDYAQRSIAFMQERRSALISAAVTGKIDVRDWQPPASAPTPELAQEAV
ncbi:restriction endonuclease subunit S [Pseudomonas sp. W5-36]|uniref:restriction endonuclease subunit S n=1 Tax=Pseudomonas sp. W5-36 TaxID=3097455 RepID=UPI0039790EE7